MVEITLPIILQILQTAGILMGIVYYITIMRNAERTRQREQVFLRLQSFDMPYNRAMDHVMNNWTGKGDYHSFDSETRVNYNFITTRYQNIGVMLREKMIDPDLLYKTFSPRAIISLWEKSEHLVRDNREDNKYTTYMEDFEYLYIETKKRYPDIVTWKQEDS